MEHILKYVEIAEFAKQDLESFQSHRINVKTIDERNIID